MCRGDRDDTRPIGPERQAGPQRAELLGERRQWLARGILLNRHALQRPSRDARDQSEARQAKCGPDIVAAAEARVRNLAQVDHQQAEHDAEREGSAHDWPGAGKDRVIGWQRQ